MATNTNWLLEKQNHSKKKSIFQNNRGIYSACHSQSTPNTSEQSLPPQHALCRPLSSTSHTGSGLPELKY